MPVVGNEIGGTTEDPAAVSEPTDEPPAYEKVVQQTGPTVTCRVCHATVNIEGKVHQHVVKCLHCGEATVSKQRNCADC